MTARCASAPREVLDSAGRSRSTINCEREVDVGPASGNASPSRGRCSGGAASSSSTEPTAALGVRESEQVFEVIRDLRPKLTKVAWLLPWALRPHTCSSAIELLPPATAATRIGAHHIFCMHEWASSASSP